jgi:kumamolisin
MIESRSGLGVAVVRRLGVVLFSTLFLAAIQTPAQAENFLTGHVRPAVITGDASYVGRMPGTQTLRIDVVLAVRDQAGLNKFLQEVYGPASPSYRHFLTVKEFTARFGPSQEDYDLLVDYAHRNGLKVVGGSRDGMDVQLEGPVASIETAFNVSMGFYQHPTENRVFYAPDREPSVDLPIRLWHVSGLDNYSIPRPALIRSANGGEKSTATTGSGPSASFLGSDMRAAYYGSSSLTGAGQYLGLLEYYGTNLTDLSTYYKNVGQTNNVPITLHSTDGTSTSCVYPRCDDTEQTIDMTQALGMAPGLSGLIMFVGSTDTAILSSMTTYSPLPQQLSSSWTWSPADPSTDDPYFEKMASQGQSFFQAAGDSGAWTRSNYPFPSEDANVICVGGTDLTTSSAAGPWASETYWASYGGGGISPDHIPIPSWQQTAGVITSTNEGSKSYRNGPDVAANANFTYYVCADLEACTANEYGGTSFAAPLWAGYAALANQQAAANSISALGFINPSIYTIGLSGSYDANFHDITSGCNSSFCAETGYDLVTGWGSMNGANLITALVAAASAPNFSLSASPTSLSVAQGSSGGSNISVSVVNGFDSAVTLSASGLPSGVTASFGTNPVTGAGTSLLTLTVASSTVTGTYTITVMGTSTSPAITQTTTVSLTVSSPAGTGFSLSASPSSLTVDLTSSGSTSITSTVAGSFDSAVSLSASGLPSGVTASFNPTSFAAPGSGASKLTFTVSRRAHTGTYTITITGTGGGLTETTTVSLTVAR